MPVDSIFHTVSNTEMHKNCISLYLQSYIVTNSLRKNIIGEKNPIQLLYYYYHTLETIWKLFQSHQIIKILPVLVRMKPFQDRLNHQ